MADSGRQEITGRRSGRYLLNRLPRRADGGVDIGEIDLSHLRVEKIDEYDLSLPRGLRPVPRASVTAREARRRWRSRCCRN